MTKLVNLTDDSGRWNTLDGKPPMGTPRNRVSKRSAKAKRHNTRSTWTPLPFSKHKGETLPQVICSDPSWFLWAVENEIFRSKRLADEAAILYRRIQGIIIPKRRPRKWVVEYIYDCDGRFDGFLIVRKSENPYLKYNRQSDCLDLTAIDTRYKGEWRHFVCDFREAFFDGKSLTKERCETFFSNESNFV
jgi:hypothetical protein